MSLRQDYLFVQTMEDKESYNNNIFAVLFSAADESTISAVRLNKDNSK